MKLLIRFLTIFIFVGLFSLVLMNVFKVEFGTTDYWHKHGVFLLIGLTIFPRLTLLFSSIASGGFIWWLSFIFAPRILVAFLATIAYFQTNPILVVMSWLIALGGEVFEKYGLSQRGNVRVFKMGSFGSASNPMGGMYQDHQEKAAKQFPDDAIEAEFTKKD